MTLYHYTCAHFAQQLENDGILKPNPKTGRAWLTDLETPIPEVLGLTRHSLYCDRTEFRFRLKEPHETNGEVVPYHVLRKYLPELTRRSLELAPGALLMHWWVTELPVAVERA